MTAGVHSFDESTAPVALRGALRRAESSDVDVLRERLLEDFRSPKRCVDSGGSPGPETCMDSPLTTTRAACVGIDWASEHHDIALQATGRAAIEHRRLAHAPEAIAEWLASLAVRFGGQPIGIALETSRGPLVHARLEAPFVGLSPINPRSLQRFREAVAPSGATDDAPDARLLLTRLVKHRDQLTCWTPDDVATRTLRRLVAYRRRAIGMRVQLTQ